MSEDKKELTPREMRIEMAKQKQANKASVSDDRKDFKKYFIKLKRKKNLSDKMEEIIWLHFKASGFDKKELFDKGILHFGL
jgi:hypothetical protein